MAPTPERMTIPQLRDEIRAADEAAGREPRALPSRKADLAAIAAQLRAEAEPPAPPAAANGSAGTSLERRPPAPPARLAPAALTVAPTVEAAELVRRLAVIEQAMNEAMKEDVDYGVIPGTRKPSLFKPGAEKLSVLFQLDVEIENEKIWGDGGHLTVISHATVWHQLTGTRLGNGEAICSTMEERYAFRKAELECPACGNGPVLKSKQGRDEFFCWRAKGGCGETFPNGSEEYAQLDSVELGKVPNPNLADTWNTVTKMATKRARVDAILSVTGASALFTQDVEDGPDAGRGGGGASGAPEGSGTQRREPEQHVAPAAKPPEAWVAEFPGYEFVPGWPALVVRVAEVIGSPEDAQAWLQEAAYAAHGQPTIRDLSEEAKRALFASVSLATAEISTAHGGGFPPPDRATIAAALAKRLDGLALEGPPWRIGPGEADRPTREEWEVEHSKPLDGEVVEAEQASADAPGGERESGPASAVYEPTPDEQADADRIEFGDGDFSDATDPRHGDA